MFNALLSIFLIPALSFCAIDDVCSKHEDDSPNISVLDKAKLLLDREDNSVVKTLVEKIINGCDCNEISSDDCWPTIGALLTMFNFAGYVTACYCDLNGRRFVTYANSLTQSGGITVYHNVI